jgi:hypothetical protein
MKVGEVVLYRNHELGLEGWVEILEQPSFTYPGRVKVKGKIEGPTSDTQIEMLEIARDLAVIPGEGVMFLECSKMLAGSGAGP